MKPSARRLCLGIVIGVGLRSSAPILAGPISFTKIADAQTVAPGGTDTFVGVGVPSLDAGLVAFRGNVGGRGGIYVGTGDELRVVADFQTPIPGGTGTFTSLGFSISIDRGNVAFIGSGEGHRPRDAQEGVYAWFGDAVELVADRNTPRPDGDSGFAGFNSPSLDGNDVAFSASFEDSSGGSGGGGASGTSVPHGLYARLGGSFVHIASASGFAAPPPGGFHFLFWPTLENGTIAFSTMWPDAIYTFADGGIEVVVGSETPVSGTSGTVTYVSNRAHQVPALDQGTIAFLGADDEGRRSLYTISDGELTIAMDLPIPIVPGAYNIHDIMLDGDNIAFYALLTGSSVRSVYVLVDDVVTRIVGPGDSLDGKVVKFVWSSNEAFDGGQFAFQTEFTDGSVGIYVATIPEPATLGLFAIGALLGLRRFPRDVPI